MFSRIQANPSDSKELGGQHGKREMFNPEMTQQLQRHYAGSPTLPDTNLPHNAIKASNAKFHVKSLVAQTSNDRGQRRQKASGSLLVPSDRINKYPPLQQLQLQRTSNNSTVDTDPIYIPRKGNSVVPTKLDAMNPHNQTSFISDVSSLINTESPINGICHPSEVLYRSGPVDKEVFNQISADDRMDAVTPESQPPEAQQLKLDKVKNISLKLKAPADHHQGDFQKIGAHVMTPPSTRAQEFELHQIGLKNQPTTNQANGRRRNMPLQLLSPVQQVKLSNKLPLNRRLELDQCIKQNSSLQDIPGPQHGTQLMYNNSQIVSNFSNMVVGENFIHSELGNLDINETSSLEHQIPSFERDGKITPLPLKGQSSHLYSLSSPQTKKMNWLSNPNVQNVSLSNPSISGDNKQASHRTDEQNHNVQVQSPNTSFRVENRRARPKIAKNVTDRGNMFFSQQANILNSSQKRHRRQIASQGNEFCLKQHMNSSIIHEKDPENPNSTFESNKDQFNFTFFRERKEQKSAGAPKQFEKDSHVNVSSLLSQAMRNETNGSDQFGLNIPIIQVNQGQEKPQNLQHSLPSSQNFTNNDYQKYLQDQRFMTYEPKEVQTPGLKSNNYPPMTRQHPEQNRSVSTGLKPATAVRFKSLPWNFANVGSDATTATSHSRRTTENLPMHKFQANLSGLDGTKPSTGSTNINGLNKVSQPDPSFMNLSKEEDVFGNLKQASQGNNRVRMTITPLYVPDFKNLDTHTRMTTASVSEQRSKFEERFAVKQQQSLLQKAQAAEHNGGGNSGFSQVGQDSQSNSISLPQKMIIKLKERKLNQSRLIREEANQPQNNHQSFSYK